MRSQISLLLILILILSFAFLQCAKKETQPDLDQAADKFMTFYNSHDIDALTNLFSENIITIAPYSPEPFVGRKAIIDAIQGIWDAMPDFRAEKKSYFTSGEYFAWEVDLIGTFTNPLKSEEGSIPPTGKEVIIHEFAKIRVTPEGLISEITEYYDAATLWKQLGMEVTIQ